MILIFQKSKLLCLQKPQVQIQSWKQICDRTKIRSLVKHGTLGVEYVLEQWKEKLRFLLQLRDHQRVDSHSFFTTLKVTKKPTSFKPLNHHDSKRLSLLHCSQSTLSNRVILNHLQNFTRNLVSLNSSVKSSLIPT